MRVSAWSRYSLAVLWMSLAACVPGCSDAPAQAPGASGSGDQTQIDSTGLPKWAIGPFTRYEGNPVMSPQGTGWEALEVLNPGVVQVNGKYQMLYRGEPSPLLSQIGLASSDDGLQWTRYENNPVIRSDIPGGVLGYEDPRLLYLDGTYYSFFTKVGTGTTDLAEATSTDLVNWNIIGVVVPGTKNGVVVMDPHGHPVKIGGQYVMYAGQMENFSVWTSPDMLHWTEQGPVDLGYGNLGVPDEVCVAITDYPKRDGSTGHDIVLFTAGHLQPTGTWFYAISETLYARDAVATQLDRLESPVFTPATVYELAGVTPATVFMNSILYNGSEWMMHYGAADTRIGLATAPARL